ncbi:MAG: hypothetical protein L6R39_007452 [Caloplaca ligustica]|nr:MAG: hypothetical protein L6R39_007452 [Caloplaca ligustica]
MILKLALTNTSPPSLPQHRTDFSIAITNFLVETFHAFAITGGHDIPLPASGVTHTWRHIKLDLTPLPGVVAPVGMSTLIAALWGVMYYMSYAPEGITERTVDVWVHNPEPDADMIRMGQFVVASV